MKGERTRSRTRWRWSPQGSQQRWAGCFEESDGENHGQACTTGPPGCCHRLLGGIFQRHLGAYRNGRQANISAGEGRP
ncbi:uncharacterized protein GLRG_11239 [Colletotrichum graminicola M1.001]|uniref:Uncharacterized protein n=1 Tax=Colletotrichum graminicola (strain M1.001 / M2 / FGSC 10212) TaxID=645133 RepID=E3QZ07_COLGM|nr:uncharacterized protein GLRG_11239 [Colletotrichum graminicola M1.001]EFQ36095.1 hypothetical protein GLRG_11239 [Colletotrichum graminicola M1.001]